jgi:hypothetical protein
MSGQSDAGLYVSARDDELAQAAEEIVAAESRAVLRQPVRRVRAAADTKDIRNA